MTRLFRKSLEQGSVNHEDYLVEETWMLPDAGEPLERIYTVHDTLADANLYITSREKEMEAMVTYHGFWIYHSTKRSHRLYTKVKEVVQT